MTFAQCCSLALVRSFCWGINNSSNYGCRHTICMCSMMRSCLPRKLERSGVCANARVSSAAPECHWPQIDCRCLMQTVHQTLTAFQESTLKEVKPISKECLEALQATLMLDPSRRATVNELLAMQWCTKDGHDAPTAVFSTQVPRRGRSKSHRDFAIQRTSPITAPQKSASLKPLKKATSR